MAKKKKKIKDLKLKNKKITRKTEQKLIEFCKYTMQNLVYQLAILNDVLVMTIGIKPISKSPILL